ncbi:hypothetical protein [Mycoplasmopsis iners]|uniref:hypothetical protein n=1 Tax=Mycoplasmopsis iners TaxID=76630 RepID=UPI0004977AD9|nr:hypothetical protein [Mycoplasmopsis iners]
MKNNSEKENEVIILPVLKPMKLNQIFMDKLGGKLNSNVILLIALEEENAYFISCYEEINQHVQESDLIKIHVDEGIKENGEIINVALAKYVDLSVIYRIKVQDLFYWSEKEHLNDLPYLGIKDQIAIVNELTKRFDDELNKPNMVYIKRKTRMQSNQIQP